MSDAQPQRKRKRAVLEAVQEDGNSKFARALGSVDYQTREKGLTALTTWLSKKHDVSELEMKKLWKGIFYCFWHADRPAFQTAFLYFSVFLGTMRREWFGIDRLRLDKFMMLVRKFVHALFESLQAQKWNLDAVSRVMACLQQDVLLNTDSHPAAGLMYHLADVFAVELREVSRAGPPPAVVLDALIEPFCQVMVRTQRAPFLARLREGFFDILMQEIAVPSAKLPFKHLAAEKLADHLFQLGALPETRARNRQELYDASKALEQALKTRQRKQDKGQKAAVSRASTDQAMANGHASKQQKQQKPQPTEASEGSAAQTADDQASAPKTALSKKKLLKKQKKAIIAAAGVGASKEGQLDKQNKQAAADQQQQQQPLPEPAFLHDAVSKKHRKQQKLASKSVGAADATGSVADAVPCAAPVQEGSVQADVSQPNGAEVQQPALKKRRVRFAMKRNLLMQIGGAVPPQEVRTPPGSRPKGSALKRSSLAVGPHIEAGSRSAGTRSGRKAKTSAGKPVKAQAKLFF